MDITAQILVDSTSWITTIGICNFISIIEIFNICGPWQAGEFVTYRSSSSMLTISLVLAVAIDPCHAKKKSTPFSLFYGSPLTTTKSGGYPLFGRVSSDPPKKEAPRETREQMLPCMHTKAPFTTHKRVFLHNLDSGGRVTSAYSPQSISHVISAKVLQKPKVQGLKAHRCITDRC